MAKCYPMVRQTEGFLTRSFVTRLIITAFCLCLALAIQPGSSVGAPFDPLISITGSTDFDNGFAFSTGSPITGGFSIRQGGVASTSTYSGTSVIGADPLAGTLTDFNDGFGFGALFSSSTVDDEVAVGIDTVINVQNNSPTDTFIVTFDISGSNSVNASGGDSFADSEFSVDLNGSETFFSDVLSDTTFGNSKNGNSTGSFGGLVNDSPLSGGFNITLAPGASSLVEIVYTGEGGIFSDPGTSDMNFDAFVGVTDVYAVPVPSTLLLLGAGLAGFVGLRRRFQS